MDLRSAVGLVSFTATSFLAFGCGNSSDGSSSTPPFDFSATCEGMVTAGSGASRGSFVAEITQLNASIGGTFNMPATGMSDEPISGSASGTTISFGDIGNKVKLEGSVTRSDGADYDLAGTYTYPALNDHGKWTATCTRGETTDAGTDDSFLEIDGANTPNDWPPPGDSSVSDVVAAKVCARTGALKTTNALDVAVDGTTLYVADGLGGLRIIDASDTFAPRQIGVLPPVRGGIVGIAVSGQYAYAVDHAAGLLVVDISSKSAPKVVGQVALGSWPDAMPITPPMRGFATISGNWVYASDGGAGMFCAVDVTSPTAPSKPSECSTNPFAVDAVIARGNFAYANGAFGFYVLNIANPDAPITVSEITNLSPNGGSFGLVGNYAWVTSSQGSRLIDVSSPIAAAVAKEASDKGLAAAVWGTTGYALEFDGLTVVDLSTPTAPRTVGRCKLPDSSSSGTIHGIGARDDRVYAAVGEQGISIWQILVSSDR